jgi:hypothetical protein
LRGHELRHCKGNRTAKGRLTTAIALLQTTHMLYLDDLQCIPGPAAQQRSFPLFPMTEERPAGSEISIFARALGFNYC